MDNSTISGSSLVDQSGNNYNGILFNAPTSVTGAFGQALQFNGINTFINLPASTFGNYPMTGNASDYGLSFAVWFKTTDKGVILGQNNHNYFPPASPGSYVPAIYIDTNSKLRASMFWHLGSDSGQIVSVKSYNDGNWHLLVDAYGSGVENLYVDGQNIGSQTKNQYSYASFYSYFLGTGYASGWPNTTASWFYYKGLLDEAKIYNRALSAGEVKTLYSALPTSVTTPPADTTVPTVVIVSPVASQSVSGAVNVNVQATDNVGVSKVELYINSVLYGTDTSAPYAFSWSAPAATSTTQNFTLVAKAYDAAGNIGASTPTVLSVAAVLPPPVSSGSAFFLNADPITSGSWKGIYGSDGYNVIGDQVNYPNYAKVSVQDNLTYLWSSSASDSKDLQKSATTATDRIAGTWYSPNAFTVDLNLIDNQPHQVSFYILDWDPRSRAQKIDVLDTSGNILDSQTVSQFSTGKYLTWTLTGHVKFRFTNLASPTTANSVLSGIFFGAKNTTTVPVAPTSPATSTPPVVTNPISNPTAGAVAVQIKNMVSFNELYIDGSPADDTISISQSGSAITVLANGSSQAFNGPFGDIVIKGEDGNDQINIDGSVTTRVLAYGNNGNNTITAAGSARVVAVTVGGGKDSITGNSNTTYWVGTEDAAHYSNNALIAGKVNIINSFYQPWTTNQSSSDYIPLALAGQKLKDPSDPSNNVVTLTDRSLFGQGPTINDIVQGRLADCYWDAGLAGLAYVVPDRLEDTGVDLGDGTYLVRFIRNNTPSFVRVDSDFDLLNNISGPNGNIWGMVYEKAYAFFRKGANTYDSLNYGFPSEWSGLGFVNDTLSPKQNVVYSNVTTNLSAKHPLDICTSGLTILDGAPVTSSHCYTVTNATASPTVTLRNPWGIDGVGNDGADDGFVTLTGTQVQDNINSINAAR